MKYAIIIPDGCADWAVESLGNRTPLQAAYIPNIQALARSGIVGQSCNVPQGFNPGSDVATLGLLGYDASLCYTGRAPLEAAAMGIDLAGNDWAIRCNLVTIQQGVMQSFSAGHITSPEAAEIMKTLNEELAPKSPVSLQFYPGVSYRNLATLRNCELPPFDQSTKTCPPHDYSDKPVAEALPAGKGSDLLQWVMDESQKILATHPVNRRRRQDGRLPATHVWLWGLGQKPQLPPFRLPRSQKGGAVITAVDLLRGIATLIGWDIIEVPGITGYIDTDYAAKGRYAAEALKKYDIVCVHIEAPDESGHEGSVEKKIWSMEQIDAKVVPPIAEALQSYGEWRLFLSPDHPTPCAIKTHTAEPVPWLLTGSGIPAMSRDYHEESVKDSPYRYDRGWETINLLFQ